VSGYIEAKELGQWRKRQVLHFEYGAEAKIVGPDFRKFKTITPQQREQTFTSAMERSSLAEAKFGKGRVVVRAIEMAQDGTVFVAYQSGDRHARSWSGYGIRLKDDQGTPYIRVGLFGNNMEGPFLSPDGKLEMEVFTPPSPVASGWKPTVTLSTQHDSKGRLSRLIQVRVVDQNGQSSNHWQPNFQDRSKAGPVEIHLTSKQLQATCATHPQWAEQLNYSEYGTDESAQIAIWAARGESFLESGQWEKAELAFNRELRAMEEFQHKGHGSWSKDRPLRGLEQAKAHNPSPLN
jgi:hypothetical protein